MFAIVNIAGQQFKVEEGQEIFVHRLEANEGEKVTFEEVMLVDDKGNTQVGTPVLDVNVTATVLSHLKGNKVIVFKKKRRKGYKVKNGHRQALTQIIIDKIA